MTKIEELRKLHRDAASTTCGQALSGLLDQLPALLDVAEAAVKHIAEKFTCDDGDVEKCDLGPEECSACNLEQALARLGEGR